MSFTEFPHRCVVVEMKVDESLPPSQRVPTEVEILNAECDIQAAGKPTDTSLVIDADYIVYVPQETILPRMQKGIKIELHYNELDIRLGEIRQYEPSMQLGNRIWVKELDS